ncbi:MAG: putative aminodeoxychorismate lyase [Microgenomates bacterium OLB23]|nr:MAG: putative aminodeoxychorismate lyase [Microgenomates bacterium OLB23]
MKKLLVVCVLGVILAIFGSVYYYEGNLPVQSTQTEKQSFVIPKGATVNDIINKLADQNLIRNKVVFLFIVKQLGIENSIQAGSFRLSPSMSAKEIALQLTKGSDDEWVTIIEGIRKEEIAEILAKQFDIPASEFIKKAPEGRLFPDTYLINKDASIETIISILTNNFEKKYTQELRQKARAKGMTDNQVITLASLVEREANSRAAKREVASILYKRLKNDWPLQVDATVQYAIGYQEREKTWWKQYLTKQDLAILTRYTTRIKNRGFHQRQLQTQA